MPHRYLLLFPGLLAALMGAAQTPRVTVKPPLTRVTVYLNGTALEHQAPVTLAAGLNRVLVSGLSPRLDADAMEVQLGDGAELLSIDEDDEQAPASVALNPTAVDSLARAEAEQHTLEGELQGLQQEKAFLLANQTLPSGTQANWSAEVQKGAALMRTRLPIIQQETDRLQSRLSTLKTQVTQLGPRANERGDGDRQVLVVRAARAGSVALTVHYYLAARSPWLPRLDIRANERGSEVKFITHGRLANRSGLPWQRVRVVLMRYAVDDVSRPDLQPWELDFRGGDHSGEGRVDEFVVKGTAKGRPAVVTQGVRYEVPELVTLPANGRRELTLPAVALPGRPEYLAVPRVSENVFLQTKVSGWEGLQLADHARVFHDGVFVGNTDLDERAYNDSLEVALGHDPLLVVGRAKLEDFSGNVPLSDKRRVRLVYELNVRNNHPEAVRLRLLDQVPISEEKEINVKVLEMSGAQLDERSGKLTWLVALPPGTSQRLRFTFQVDYPKDKNVEIINHRVHISNPKFR
ncbi:mucoidy inhibitor MuiA family protein [Hymenobacter arcticus]